MEGQQYIYSKMRSGQTIVWIIGFLFSPIIALLFALWKRNEYGAKLVIFLFSGLFGYLMNTTDYRMDLYRYLNLLQETPYNDISSVFANQYSSGSNSTSDLYVSLLQTIIGSFTNNGHILMLAFGLVFGIFYVKMIKLLPKFSDKTLLSFGIFFLFINVFGIQGLAGVRFYTAFYVFAFGAISYINTSKKIYLLTFPTACLIHFSYIFAVFLFAVYYVFKAKPYIIYMIVGLSFVMSFTSISSIISQYASYLGGSIETRANTYSLENTDYVDFVNNIQSETVWYVALRGKIVYWAAVISLSLIGIYHKRIKIDEKAFQYILLALVFLSCRNIIINIPDFGSRYNAIFIALFYFLLYHIFMQNRGSILVKIISYMSILGGIFYTLYSIRCMFYYVSILDISLSPIIILFK